MKAATALLLGLLVIGFQSCEDDPPADTSAKAKFGVSGYDVPVPATISFINTSSNASSHLWKFGDGTSSTEMNPSHVYTAIGTYIISLKVTGHNGTVDSVQKVLYWGDATDASKSSFSYFQDRYVGLPVNISFNSLNPLSIFPEWSFGNGVIASIKNPIMQFAAPGDYPIQFSSQINGVRDTVNLIISLN
jgi:PKD repeat protein